MTATKALNDNNINTMQLQDDFNTNIFYAMHQYAQERAVKFKEWCESGREFEELTKTQGGLTQNDLYDIFNNEVV